MIFNLFPHIKWKEEKILILTEEADEPLIKVWRVLKQLKTIVFLHTILNINCGNHLLLQLIEIDSFEISINESYKNCLMNDPVI